MAEQDPDVKALLERAQDAPETVDVATAVEALDAENGTKRTLALRALAHVAREAPDDVAAHADSVRDSLDDGYPVAENAAALVCTELARERPETVRPAVPRLVAMLGEVPPQKGYRAARALIPVLETDPAAFVPVADGLVDVLADSPAVEIPTEDELAELPEDERRERIERLSSHREQIQQDLSRSYGIREFAAHALVEVAEVEPAALTDRVADVTAGLGAEPVAVRAATADALATLASADPAAVGPAVDDLVDVLESDEDDGVRAYAVRALGHAGATEAVEPLRGLAEADVDPELAALAADTADFLADEE